MNLYELVPDFSSSTHGPHIQNPNVNNIIFSHPFLAFLITSYNDDLGKLNHTDSLGLGFNTNKISYDNLSPSYFQVV